MSVREALSCHRYGAEDRLVLRDEDRELEASASRYAEVAEVFFAYRDERGEARDAMSLTVYSDGSFSVGQLATVGTHNFHGAAEAVGRAKAMVDALGLRPKVWGARP